MNPASRNATLNLGVLMQSMKERGTPGNSLDRLKFRLVTHRMETDLKQMSPRGKDNKATGVR